MMNISLAIMIDHNNRCIIYGEIAIITQLEQYFEQEMRRFTMDQDFSIERAPDVFANVLTSKTEIK